MFSVFFLFSTMIWFLNALSKEYTAEIKYPLKYRDFPEAKVLVGEVPGHLDLGVSATGYSILRYKILKKPVPISFKLEKFNLNWEQATSRAFILSAQLEEQIDNHLPSELKLLEINPDTLHFLFSDSESRLVKVEPGFSYEVDKQFTVIGAVEMNPDSVMVTGPVVIMDTLRAIYTEAVDPGVLERDYTRLLSLISQKDLMVDPPEVECRIRLERFTEKELLLPIEVLHQPDSIMLQTIPTQVTLTCRVGLSLYEKLGSHPFRAQVDFREVDERSGLLSVRISNVPDYLLSYEFYPRSVEFIKVKR